VQFTASAELRDKLERLQALMRSSVPAGALEQIIEEAVTEKLERLESKRFGKTKAPRKGLAGAKTTPSSRHIPAPIRRAVYERDGGRCTYVDKRGRRCTSRKRLEFHHEDPFGLGGTHSLRNLRLACRAHNALLAERDYGKDVMDRYRHGPDRVFERAVVYKTRARSARRSLPEREPHSVP
jgi:5-methylcytosine-specific restriction endonuclease McrA